MVLSFSITDASSGKLLRGNLILDRLGESVIYPFKDGKVDVAMNSVAGHETSIKYEVWVPGYVPSISTLIGVYPRSIDVKLSPIDETPTQLNSSSYEVLR